MPYRIFFVLMTVLYAGTQLHSQILDQLAAKLIKEYENNSKELILLQTDKSIYQAGTEIWFRVYSVSSNGFPVDSKDKVIYVELVNASDSVIDRVLLNKEALQYNGSIPIPGILKEGFYQLRAYTRTILLEHPADIFIDPVYITNNGRKERMNQENSSDPVFKFYPEGDHLINGVSSVVVFTAADKNGMPLQVSGFVKDNFGNEMVKFAGNGIGRFSFEPYSKDRTYKVYIKTNSSTEQVYSLPAIRTGAFQLSLQKQTPEELVFRVALGDSAYSKKASSYLLGIAGGKVCFASEGKAMYMVNIPVNTLPHGLIDFYLYDENKELKSKRSVFNAYYNTAVNIISDKQEYPSRQRVKLTMNVTDGEGKPVKSVFSVSVTDKKLTEENLPMHAADIYMLSRSSSGLALLINNFLTNNEGRDLVAITAGSPGQWVNTPEVKTDKDFYWDGLEIKGKVSDKQNSPLAGQIIVLMPEEESTTLNDSTDQKGVFAFRGITFYGKKRFHVMIPSVYDKQEKYEIEEEKTLFPVVHTSSLHKANTLSFANLPFFNQQHADSSIAGSTRVHLQQLLLQEAGGNKKTKTSKTGLSPRRITGEQLDKLSFSNTADAVKMLPGVIMMGGRLTIRGGMQSLSGDLSDIEPLLVVNGVNTRAASVVDYLNSIPPTQIEYIEVYTGPEGALYGSRGGNGAIVVKTTNELRDSKGNKERQTIVASGFYKDQNFYEPPYDSYAVREASFVDNRATIYWNGQVITDDAGKATVSFHTADLKNDYTVTVQGITEKGELIFKTYTIKKK